jgi:hypothetical protein
MLNLARLPGKSINAEATDINRLGFQDEEHRKKGNLM